MRKCLFFTRRLIDKALEKLGETPDKIYGIHQITVLTFDSFILSVLKL